GRTARAGAAGSAISFCADEERPYLRDIERLTRLPLTVVAAPSTMRLANVPARRAPEHAVPQPNPSRRRRATNTFALAVAVLSPYVKIRDGDFICDGGGSGNGRYEEPFFRHGCVSEPDIGAEPWAAGDIG